MTVIYELSGTLTAASPVHIGAASGGTVTDLILVRDGEDRFLLPGTSLAGVLRALLGEGDHRRWGEVTSNAAWTSAVTVFDARAEENALLVGRNTTSIDRRTGAAARSHLFSREFLATGTTFDFRCVIEGSTTDATELRDLAESIAAALRGGVRVGAASGAGYGRVTLSRPHLVERRIERASLAQALGKGLPLTVLAANDSAARAGVLRVTIPFRARGPLLVGQGVEGAAIDRLPLTVTARDNVHFVLPGTSLKGALRSHAETIARTVAAVGVPEKFLDQVAGTGVPAVGDLFGLAAGVAEGPDGRKHATGNRGAVSVAEVRSTQGIPTAQWRNLITAERIDAPRTVDSPVGVALRRLNATLKKAEPGSFLDLAVRNSVDRFSGATVDGKLFSSLEPHVRWNDLQLELDIALLRRHAGVDPNRVNAALALLLFVLIDLRDGAVRFGASVTRGAGGIDVDAGRVTLDATAVTGDGDLAARLNGTLAALLADGDLLDELSRSWVTYLPELEEAK